MSRKSRNDPNRNRKRSTRTDMKLYTRYNTRAAAEADIDRLIMKAEAMQYNSDSYLVAALQHDRPGIAIQPAGEDTAGAKRGTDYQSIIISKQRNRGEVQWHYAQDRDGTLNQASPHSLHVADDPAGTDLPDRPSDRIYRIPEPSEERHQYEPLKGPDGKRDKARRYVDNQTGQIISRRAHMKLRGIIPEIKAADRAKWNDGTGEGGFIVVVSYGVTTND